MNKLTLLLLILFIGCNNKSNDKIVVDPVLVESIKNKTEYSDFLEGFQKYMCECISKPEYKDNVEALDIGYRDCVASFMLNNQNLMQVFTDSIRSSVDTPKDDYEIGYNIEITLGQRGNTLLARECTFFQNEYDKIKKLLLSELGVNESNVDELIDMMKLKFGESNSEEEKVNFFAIIGILYEWKGETNEAGAIYMRGILMKQKGSNMCSILLELL